MRKHSVYTLSRSDDGSGRFSHDRRILEMVASLMKGKAQNRHTVSKQGGVSLPTADRWIRCVLSTIPGAALMKEGKTVWIYLEGFSEDVKMLSPGVFRKVPTRAK